jgi:hypothetical protein
VEVNDSIRISDTIETIKEISTNLHTTLTIRTDSRSDTLTFWTLFLPLLFGQNMEQSFST